MPHSSYKISIYLFVWLHVCWLGFKGGCEHLCTDTEVRVSGVLALSTYSFETGSFPELGACVSPPSLQAKQPQ